MDEIFAAIEAYAATEGADAEKLLAVAEACDAIAAKDPDSPETMALLEAVLALITADDAEETEEAAPAQDPPTQEETV